MEIDDPMDALDLADFDQIEKTIQDKQNVQTQDQNQTLSDEVCDSCTL